MTGTDAGSGPHGDGDADNGIGPARGSSAAGRIDAEPGTGAAGRIGPARGTGAISRINPNPDDNVDRYAVIGWPLAHTLSPRIHRLFAEQTGQALRYDALPVQPEALDDAIDAFIREGGRGLNVTVPHKVRVFERFFEHGFAAATDEATLALTLAGAANTVVIDQPSGRVTLANTDGAGLVRDLTVNLGRVLAGARVLMVGAGGAARGVTVPLLDAGIERLTLVNRTPARAQAIVDHVHRLRPPAAGSGSRLQAVGFARLVGAGGAGGERYDLIINATSAGLSGERPPLPDVLAAGTFCYDMLYGADTPFARWARAHGAAGVALGLGMLVEQAAESFRHWRGVRPATAPVLDLLRREPPA